MSSKKQKVVPVPELTVRLKKDQVWYCVKEGRLRSAKMVKVITPTKGQFLDRTSASWLAGNVGDLQLVEKLAIMTFDDGGIEGFCHYSRGKTDGRLLNIYCGEIWNSHEMYESAAAAVAAYRYERLAHINTDRDNAIKALDVVVSKMMEVA